MKIAVFAKRRQTKEGKVFFNYLSTITNKDGDVIPVQVKFREQAGVPRAEMCPRYIEFDKHDANLTTREYTDPNTAEIRKTKTLWISKWVDGGEYIDHSMDNFDD